MSPQRAKELRALADEEERAVVWRAVVGNRRVWRGGPGLSASEAEDAAERYLRSGYHQGGSSDYHRFQVVPEGRLPHHRLGPACAEIYGPPVPLRVAR